MLDEGRSTPTSQVPRCRDRGSCCTFTGLCRRGSAAQDNLGVSQSSLRRWGSSRVKGKQVCVGLITVEQAPSALGVCRRAQGSGSQSAGGVKTEASPGAGGWGGLYSGPFGLKHFSSVNTQTQPRTHLAGVCTCARVHAHTRHFTPKLLFNTNPTHRGGFSTGLQALGIKRCFTDKETQLRELTVLGGHPDGSTG